MEIEVRLAGETDEQVLRSLEDWLRNETELRRTARVEFRSAVGDEGDMLGFLPAFIVVLATAGQTVEAAKFVASVARWVKERGHLAGVLVGNKRGGTEIVAQAVIEQDDPATIASVEQVIADGGTGED